MIVLSNDNIANIPGSKSVLSGGRARFARDFSRFLNKRGHQWIGVVSKLSPSDKTRLIKTTSPHYWYLQVPIKFHQQLRQDKKVAAEKIFQPAIEKCCQLMKKVKPDIVFINGNSTYPWIFLQAGRKMGLPIITQHAGIMKISLDRNKKAYSRRALKVMHKIEKDFSKLADKNIFISKLSQRAYNRRVKKFSRKKQSVITLPYNPKFIERQPKRKEKTKIGLVARWDQIKNHRAAANLAELADKQNLPWQLYSMTSLPQNTKDKKIINKYKKYIKVKKQQNDRQLKNFYRQMDLMILPSHFETLGFVVMEAALVGTGTIISPNVGWIDDYRKLKMNDWVVDFNKPQKAIKKINKIIGQSVPQSFVKFILKNNKPESVFNQYLKLFKQTIKEKKYENRSTSF